MNPQDKADLIRLGRLTLLTVAALIVALAFGSWHQLVQAAGIAAWLLVLLAASGLVAAALPALALLARWGHRTACDLTDEPGIPSNGIEHLDDANLDG